MLLLPYGEELKKHRAAFFRMLQPRVIGGYEKYQENGTKQLMYDMLMRPQCAFLNTKRYSGGLVFRLTYGIRPGSDTGDRNLKACMTILENFVDEVQPGAHLVDALPILDLLPDFLAPWRRKAIVTHNAEIEMCLYVIIQWICGSTEFAKVYSRLAGDVKRRLQEGDSTGSSIARLSDEQSKLGIDDMTIAYLGASSMEAGIGTTSAQILWFFVAALLLPWTVKRAQEELDSVLVDQNGVLLMPQFHYFPSLPYCAALVKEVFRWAPSIPAGVPHHADQSDGYLGYQIDKGSVMVPNMWAMQHDEEFFRTYSRCDSRQGRRGTQLLSHKLGPICKLRMAPFRLTRLYPTSCIPYGVPYTITSSSIDLSLSSILCSL